MSDNIMRNFINIINSKTFRLVESMIKEEDTEDAFTSSLKVDPGSSHLDMANKHSMLANHHLKQFVNSQDAEPSVRRYHRDKYQQHNDLHDAHMQEYHKQEY